MTAPLAVDPSALAGIGGTVSGDGESIAAAVGSLSSALSGAGAMFGHDAAGLVFGRSYTASGRALLDAAAAAVNACRRVGFGVQMSASNYGRANARSTVGGGASPVPVPTVPVQFSAPTMPPPLGGGVAAPLGWTLVEAFVGDVWPDGNPGQMHAAAAAWRSFGAAMSGLAAQVGATGPGLGGQQIPEAGQMSAAVGQIGAGLSDIATQAQSLATAVDGFAATVETTQNAVRGLLHQLSPGGVLETIGGIFTGHDPMEKVREVAGEIKTVLNNMKREADASSQIFSQGINLLDSATNSLENWAHKEFTEAFGQDVGNALSFGFNGLVDLPEGGLKFVAQTAESLQQLDPTRFAYDPGGAAKSWGGMLETTAELTNPVLLAGKIATDPQGSLNTLKGLVDYQDVADGHPFRALGYDSAQVGAMLIPGVGEAEPAIAGAEVETRAAATEVEAEQQAASAAARDGAPVAAGATSATEGVTTQAGRISSDLNNIKVPENSAPTAGPGASVPGGRAPIDTAPPVEAPHEVEPAPAPAEPAPAPSGSGYADGPRPAGAPDSYPEQPSAAASTSLPNDVAPSPRDVSPLGSASDGFVPISEGEHAPAMAAPGDLAAVGGDHGVDTAATAAGADDRGPAAVGAHSPSAGEAGADGLGSSGNGHAGPDQSLGNGRLHDGSYGGGPGGDEPHGSDSGANGQHGPNDHHGETHTGLDSHDGSTHGEHDHGSGHDDASSHHHGLSDEKRDEILAMEKGSRPDPSEYLSPEYVKHHLENFDNGASRFMPLENLEKYGIAQSDGTSFVMSANEIDALMDATKGDPRAMEQALGWPEGYLDKHTVIRIDIPDPQNYNLRIPSGNEAGANDLWLPGGLLPDGLSEAVIDGSEIPPDDYSITDLTTIEGENDIQ